MIKVRDIYNYIDSFAPFSSQDSFDNSGLLIGSYDEIVYRVLICLDITQFEIKKATKIGANLIISHHPVIFYPLKKIETGSVPALLLQNKINVISAHTNADMFFLTDALLQVLGPETSGEVLQTINKDGTGYGKIIPFTGTAKSLIKLCGDKLGRVTANNYNGDIHKTAVCPGSGNGVFPAVTEKNCDAFITGELKHDAFVSAAHLGKPLIITAGHFYSELPFCNFLQKKLQKKFDGLKSEVFAYDFYN